MGHIACRSMLKLALQALTGSSAEPVSAGVEDALKLGVACSEPDRAVDAKSALFTQSTSFLDRQGAFIRFLTKRLHGVSCLAVAMMPGRKDGCQVAASDRIEQRLRVSAASRQSLVRTFCTVTKGIVPARH